MYQFSDKINNFEFLGPTLPKNKFWGRNFKNLGSDLESASLRYYVNQFLDKRNTFEFLGPNFPKNELWSRNFKNLSLDSESTPLKYHVCQFSVKIDNFSFLDLNFGKLPYYVQYFGSNIVDGVAEGWVEAEMSWVEVDGAEWRLKWVGWR